MNKDEILVPILNAINDLREEVRVNRKEIQKIEKQFKKILNDNENKGRIEKLEKARKRVIL